MGAAAPALAAGGAATAVGGAAVVGGAIKVADTATDIASVISNHKMLKQMEAFSEAMQSGERAINDMDNRIGQAVPLVSGKQQGFLEGLIGQITEHTLAKPQRQRLISDYLSQLRAEFRQRMGGLAEEVIAEIEQTLQAEADGKRRSLEDSLSRLKDEREAQKSVFEARMKRLASYKQLLPALPAAKETLYLPR
jgi:parvulin-like peptidyl-prolyl isomerase